MDSTFTLPSKFCETLRSTDEDHIQRERRTHGSLFVWMQLLEQRGGIVYHVRAFRQFILSSLYLLDRKEFMFGNVRKKRKNQMAIAVWDNGLGEVVLGHIEDL